jgi:hypothetical protein
MKVPVVAIPTAAAGWLRVVLEGSSHQALSAAAR